MRWKRSRKMDVTILGSGTAIPDGERGSPGLAVSVDGTLLLMDLGSGSLYRADRFGIPVDQVDCILITHLHPDHHGDLVPLLFAFRNPELERNKGLLLVGPRDFGGYLRKLEQIYGTWIDALDYRREIRMLEEQTISFETWRLRSCPVRHGTPSLAYEITDSRGKRVVYSGDTGYCPAISSFASGADLLILECSFPEGPEREGHLIPSQAGRIAEEAECKHLLLTHFYPACRGQDLLSPCKANFSGRVSLAEDGLRLEI